MWPAIAVMALVLGVGGGVAGSVVYEQTSDSSGGGGGGAGLTVDNTRTAPPILGDTTSVAAVADELLPSTVQITAEYEGEANGATGSGFVLDDEGHVVTNNHVVEQAAEDDGPIQIVDQDGNRYDAEIVGRSPVYDLAVLFSDEADLKPAALGESLALRVGDSVVAIGSPLGLSSTVTAGIVSAMDRPVTTGDSSSESSYINAVQTDAAINPGNSGGPLVNLAGQVVGVNSAIATTGGGITGSESGNIGVGFAIPIEQVKVTADQILRTGEASYPIIGASVADRSAGRLEGAEIEEVAGRDPRGGRRAREGRRRRRPRGRAGHRRDRADRLDPDPPARRDPRVHRAARRPGADARRGAGRRGRLSSGSCHRDQGLTRSPISVVTSWPVIPGTRVTAGASASRGQASGVSELWKTGIISRVHHWYQRTCARRRRGVRRERGRQVGAVASAWCRRPRVGEGERGAGAELRAHRVGGVADQHGGPAAVGQAVRRAHDDVAVARRQQVVDPVEQRRELAGQRPGLARARRRARGPARAGIVAAALRPEHRGPARARSAARRGSRGCRAGTGTARRSPARPGRRRSTRARRTRRRGRGRSTFMLRRTGDRLPSQPTTRS